MVSLAAMSITEQRLVGWRVLKWHHGCLQVERPWSDVLKAFPPPLYRHRYGT